MAKETMTSAERVRAALVGETVDRVPLCFWHHFQPEGSGERLAAQTLEFFRDQNQLDIVKIMPDLPYPAPEQGISQPSQWRALPRLRLDTPHVQANLTCIRTIRESIGPDFPLLITLFSPLTQALMFAANGRQAGIALARQDPAAFKAGLQMIADNLGDQVEAYLQAGVSGIFFSCMGATNTEFTMGEYAALGRPYDLQVLKRAGNGWLNIVHAHVDPDRKGDGLYFTNFIDYPVQVISWSDRLTAPSLREAQTLTSKCLMGGLAERGPMTTGPEADIENEINDALAQTGGGRRLILANGCSILDDTPQRWLYLTRVLVSPIEP